MGAWLDGALDEATARSAAAHVGTCGVCRRNADELRRLRALLSRATRVGDPDWTGFWQGVVRGIEEGRTRRPVRPAARWWWRPQWAAAALAATLLVSLGVWQLVPGHHPLEAGVLVSSASTGAPHATVMVYGPPERDVAVVWVLGLE